MANRKSQISNEPNPFLSAGWPDLSPTARPFHPPTPGAFFPPANPPIASQSLTRDVRFTQAPAAFWTFLFRSSFFRGGPFSLKRAGLKEHRLTENTIGLVCAFREHKRLTGCPNLPTPGGVRSRLDWSAAGPAYNTPSELAHFSSRQGGDGWASPATCDGSHERVAQVAFKRGRTLFEVPFDEVRMEQVVEPRSHAFMHV